MTDMILPRGSLASPKSILPSEVIELIGTPISQPLSEIRPAPDIGRLLIGLGGAEGLSLLDSGDQSGRLGRYSYLGIRPLFTIYQYGDEAFCRHRSGMGRLRGDVLDALAEHLRLSHRPPGAFPFSSGFIGHITYDFSRFIDVFRPRQPKSRVLSMPLAEFSYYDSVIVWDHADGRTWLVGDQALAEVIRQAVTVPCNAAVPRLTGHHASVSREKYEETIRAIKQYIAQGDCYQANISQRFTSRFMGSPELFYQSLREISPAPFGAFLRRRSFAILCNSPERYLLKRGAHVETCPIKGTRKRAKDPRRDRALIEELMASEKDRAEHIMIVDLERSDLGRICKTGSVHVPELMRVESYANVHHLVSTIAGKVKEGVNIVDCIRASFPGGSVTGAPKLRSMEIIDELEPVSRGIYCGAIGYIDNSGDADLNIAIRTGVVTNGQIYFSVGGGIVADSDPPAEYEETLIKARSFLAAMGLGEVAS